MKKKIVKLCMLAVAVLLLSGCSKSLDELYALPVAPKDYENLQSRINEVISAGGEPTAPLSGDKIQSVQLQDLDGDGVQEAIAFFRVSGDKPLKIYIFRQEGEEYRQAAVIEGAGYSINSVAYENMDDVPGQEIIVSWQMSNNINYLSAYSVDLRQDGPGQPGRQAEVVELIHVNYYTDFQVMDFDQDMQMEIVVLQYNQEGGGQADCYNFKDGVVCLDSSAELTVGASGVQEKKAGKLKGGVPALFVTSPVPSLNENVYTTDIFAWRDGRIENITQSKDEGGFAQSNIHYYYTVACTDINGDDITEVPQPQAIESRENKLASTAPKFFLVEWRQFALDGSYTTLYTTYYNNVDEWFFVLPDEWVGNLSLERSDAPGGGERCVIFSYRPREDRHSDPAPFLSIYKLSGTNSRQRAKLPGRFNLLPEEEADEDVRYVAMLDPDGWDCGLDEADIMERFHLIRSDWSSN